MMRIINEPEFVARLQAVLWNLALLGDTYGCVTGPGRSGAIAAAYASHMLGIPFIPYGQKLPEELGRALIIDTAAETGATLRKAQRKYAGRKTVAVALFQEPPRVTFWYEARKPQHYWHEKIKSDFV